MLIRAARRAARTGAAPPFRFRAYHSRRYKHNYYARKAYIAAVVGKSDSLRRELEQHLQAQVDEAIATQELKARSEVEALSAKLHHLVSTKTVAGIYNSPMHDGFLPTAFSIPVEQHLRNAIKPQLREDMRRSAKGKLMNTKPQLSLAPSEPYVSRDERRREHERASKLGFVAGNFNNSAKASGPFADAQLSIQAGLPYVDGNKLQLTRATNKSSWVSSKARARALRARARLAPPRTSPCALSGLTAVLAMCVARALAAQPFHTAVPSNKLLEGQ